LGLSAASLIGSAYLFFSAFRAQSGTADCPGLAAADCQLLQETRGQMARTQVLSAVGLALLALATFLYLRSRRRAAGGTP
jgi:LPXTG-motif cell wall-anchored protein